jgi:ankyrin repeat protein
MPFFRHTDIDTINLHENTPLNLAVEQGRTNIIPLLKKYGAKRSCDLKFQYNTKMRFGTLSQMRWVVRARILNLYLNHIFPVFYKLKLYLWRKSWIQS